MTAFEGTSGLGSPAAAHSKNLKSGRTPADVIFQIFLACYGLHAASLPKRWTKIACSVTWTVASCFYTLTGLWYVCDKLIAPSRLSLSEITVILGVTSYSLFLPYLLFGLLCKRRSIQPHLRHHGRKLGEVFPFLMLLLLIIPWIIYKEEFRTVIASFSMLSQHMTMAVSFMIYEDMACSLDQDHRRIRDALGSNSSTWEQLVAAKWGIRDRTRDINTLTGVPLAVSYANLFVSSVYITADMILQGGDIWLKTLAIVSHSANLIMHFVVARKASEVRSRSEETERELLRRLGGTSTLGSVDTATMECLKFHPEWDTLYVGCFTHSLQNLSKFTSIIITCVAVVLQFDFRVVRTINDLSKLEPSNH